jgi:hypothetical protein
MDQVPECSQLRHFDVMRDEMNVLFGDLHYWRNNRKGSAMYFDPVLLSRMQFAWVIAWHNHAMATMATFIQTRDPSVFIPPLSGGSSPKDEKPRHPMAHRG